VAHAVKSFRLAGMSAAMRAEFADEVGVFLSMDHPHIARLLAVYESEEAISMVMECCEGGELLHRLREKKSFTEEEAARTTWQMLLAINYMHSEGVVHRDLKLQNFVYDEKDSNFLKMIDFGFSYYFQAAKSTTILATVIRQGSEAMSERVGTILYMAPEVIKGSYHGGSCDMWSLGVMVFAMLSGYLPFHGSSEQEITRAILRGRPTPTRSKAWRAGLSKPAQDFLNRLLVVSPRDRMTACQAMQHPWFSSGALQPNVDSDNILHSSPALSTECVAAAFIGFARASRFEQACMQLMAWSLPLAERRELRSTFLELDTSFNGSLRSRQLDRSLRKTYLMGRADRRAVRKALEFLDADDDGDMHYSDFLAAMMAHHLQTGRRSAAEEAFRRLDAEGAGYLTEESMWKTLQGQVSRAELRDGCRTLSASASASEEAEERLGLEAFLSYLFEQARSWSVASQQQQQAWPQLRASSTLSSLTRRLGLGRSRIEV
jgi:calcium-dependent protein kinase